MLSRRTVAASPCKLGRMTLRLLWLPLFAAMALSLSYAPAAEANPFGDLGRAIKQGAKESGKALKEGGHVVKEGVKNGGRAVKSTIKGGGTGARSGVKAGGRGGRKHGGGGRRH